MRYKLFTAGVEIIIDGTFSLFRETVGFGSENGPDEGELEVTHKGDHFILSDDKGLTSLVMVRRDDTSSP